MFGVNIRRKVSQVEMKRLEGWGSVQTDLTAVTWKKYRGHPLSIIQYRFWKSNMIINE